MIQKEPSRAWWVSNTSIKPNQEHLKSVQKPPMKLKEACVFSRDAYIAQKNVRLSFWIRLEGVPLSWGFLHCVHDLWWTPVLNASRSWAEVSWWDITTTRTKDKCWCPLSSLLLRGWCHRSASSSTITQMTMKWCRTLFGLMLRTPAWAR